MRALAVLLFALTACTLPEVEFVCASDAECDLNGRAGVCEATGYCSFESAACITGREYGPHAGELTGTCVERAVCGNAVLDPLEECDCGDGSEPLGPGCTEPNDPSASSLTATCRSDCRVARCGNGVVDAGEVCDDGNLMQGDGCVPDCSSDESCGNGITDLFTDEQCDDGNTRNHDGCDKACRNELHIWRQREIMPSERWGTAMAYDAYRDRVVLFGGRPATDDLADTWEWSGTGWRQMFPAVSPPARHGHAMAYDAKRKRTVLFGGADGDTWEWDGTTWTRRTPSLAPPVREQTALAYDAARERIVLFGGRSSALSLSRGDTWEWDGTVWSERTPTTLSPDPRYGHAMAYDAQRARIVLFGGVTSQPVSDTWEWDGTNWTLVGTTAPSTLQRRGYTLAYDPRCGRTVLQGGSEGSVTGHSDTWAWDGAQWTTVSSATLADGRSGAAMVFTARDGRALVFGGNRNDGTLAPDTHVLDGPCATPAWLDVTPSRPTARVLGAAAYDRMHARIVLHGGQSDNGDLDSTLVWTDGWQPLTTSGGPSARHGHGLVAEPFTSRLILHGGVDGAGNLSDTWVLDGDAWTQLATSGPAGALAMACDANGDVVVLADGSTELSSWADATTSWSVISTLSPSVTTHALTYDERRGRTILRGEDGGQNTWEWDGTSWVAHTPAHSPSATTLHSLAFDPIRGQVVSFGGAWGNMISNETWAWDGTDWIEIAAAAAPERAAHALAFDAASAELVVFSGTDANALVDDTWVLRWDGSTAPDEACRSNIDLDGDGEVGCGDDECWPWCDPWCPPTSASCSPTRPRCGDGVCNEALETCRSCSQDCATCESVCGDFVCDPGETTSSCRHDCP